MLDSSLARELIRTASTNPEQEMSPSLQQFCPCVLESAFQSMTSGTGIWEHLHFLDPPRELVCIPLSPASPAECTTSLGATRLDEWYCIMWVHCLGSTIIFLESGYYY